MGDIATVNYYKRERDALQERVDILQNNFRNLKLEYMKLEERVAYLEQFEKGGKFWLRMQTHIRDISQVRDSWNEFYTMYAICVSPDEFKDL